MNCVNKAQNVTKAKKKSNKGILYLNYKNKEKLFRNATLLVQCSKPILLKHSVKLQTKNHENKTCVV